MYYSEYVDRYLSLTCESRRKFNGYIKKISTEALCLYIKCANQSFLGGRPRSPTPPLKKLYVCGRKNNYDLTCSYICIYESCTSKNCFSKNFLFATIFNKKERFITQNQLYLKVYIQYIEKVCSIYMKNQINSHYQALIRCSYKKRNDLNNKHYNTRPVLLHFFIFFVNM